MTRFTLITPSALVLALALGAHAHAASISGTTADDVLTGAALADTLSGDAGNDRLRGDPIAAMKAPTAVKRVVLANPPVLPAGGGGTLHKPTYSADGKRLAAWAQTGEDGASRPLFDVVVYDTATWTEVERISLHEDAQVSYDGALPDRLSLSPDGNRVAFATVVDLDVAGDTHIDIFVYDLATDTATRVSKAADGTKANHHSLEPVFSPDGKRIAFSSRASNLVAGGDDTNTKFDTYMVDLTTSAVTRVSLGFDGKEPDQDCYNPAFSPVGNRIAFFTSATGMVEGDQNGERDIFIRDLGVTPATTTRVSLGPNGVEGDFNSTDPVFSPDGSKIAFLSFAKTFAADDDKGKIDVFVRDLVKGTTTLVTRPNSAGAAVDKDSASPAFSPDGTKLFFETAANTIVATDNDGDVDLFMADLAAGTVIPVSTKAGGAAANGNKSGYAVSPDGLTIVYSSQSPEIVVPDPNATTADLFVATLAPSTGGADTLLGGPGNDVLTGGPGNDRLDGGAGSDTLDGGAGVDTAVYSGSTTGVSVSLAAGTGAGDTLAAIENLTGSAKNDTLTGSGLANALVGLAGNDALRGGAGNDRLTGGAGRDVLTGGAGRDVFVYLRASDSTRDAYDEIKDFSAAAGDKIDLSAVDANPNKAGRQSFTYIGKKRFSGKRGELRFSRGYLLGDLRGNTRATFKIKLGGVTGVPKTALKLN